MLFDRGRIFAQPPTIEDRLRSQQRAVASGASGSLPRLRVHLQERHLPLHVVSRPASRSSQVVDLSTDEQPGIPLASDQMPTRTADVEGTSNKGGTGAVAAARTRWLVCSRSTPSFLQTSSAKRAARVDGDTDRTRSTSTCHRFGTWIHLPSS